MVKLPSISIVSPTYNCDLKIFKESLESIKNQDYPKELIEQIRIDGGSENDTVKLARSYGAKVIERPDLLEASQERMGIAFLEAKNEIILILESDNILIGKNWLKLMVQPFIENKDIFCTFSMYNGLRKSLPALTRYFALFGTNDAFLYYLGKIEKMPLDVKNKYDKGAVIKENSNYFTVKFDSSNLPPMGDNGFMIRQKVLREVLSTPKGFMHVDAWASLVRKGYNKFGVVKNSIIHYSGNSIIKQYKNRVLIKKKFFDKERGRRDYYTFNFHSLKDMVNLLKFIVIAGTFVIPIIRSLKGYSSIRDIAWFFHPLVCFVALFMYSTSELFFLINYHGRRA
ncbi:MAG: glycosyltransferase family 2 protein [Patescibacteria group bacterium]|nr:glycosyltransferase family 2 protein [Patescibacteria group bacterium]